MLCESFNARLKGKYFEGKQNKRCDKVLHVIFKSERDQFWKQKGAFLTSFLDCCATINIGHVCACSV